MLEAEKVYHIYNQANGNENLFREERNYPFFLERYKTHLQPVARTYAWCLMPNHFHLMIRIRKEEEIVADLTGFGNLSGLVSQRFSSLFNAY
ncbi:MAG: hypothetical protein ICV79_18180, partial [Flavisolibacter sp.]|nr:hypothetical protein [Flavisolibacter sp.]